MPIRIIETDPGAGPRQKFSDDIVGRFRSGYLIGNRPASLDKWRVTSGDPEVTTAISDLFGGDPQPWEAKGEDNVEVFTEADEVSVIIEAIFAEMVLWGRTGKIRSCDGITQKDPAKGQPCACPSSFKDRQDAAKAGHGCQPSITVVFRLADNPELGKFKFTSGAWSLAKEIATVEANLAKVGGPAKGTIALEVVEYTTKEGQKRKFTKPVITVEGPA